MRIGLMAVAAVAMASSAMAQQRELSAHEHGVGNLDIAFEGKSIVMELKAPGADIVGFEHPADSAADRAAMEEAIALLAKPTQLFGFPQDAQCVVTKANVALADEDGHDEAHGGDEEGHSDGGHSDEATHADHDANDAHDEEATHTEFHAEYELSCFHPSRVTQIEFPYFETFPNAGELEVQLITEKGANRYEVESDNPRIDLAGMI